MSIFISGSLAFDRIMDFPGRFADHILPEKIHVLNVSFEVNGLKEKLGGTAGNIAYSLSLLDEKPLVLSCAGRDFGPYRTWMESHGLPQDGIKILDDEFTAGCYITTDQSDNQITGFNPGAMKYTSDYSFAKPPEDGSIAIVAPGNLDDMVNYSRAYKEQGTPYIYDPGQQIPITPGELMREMIDGSAITISNDYEIEMIMKATGWSLEQILERTQTVITTMGENGSAVRSNGTEETIKAVKPGQVVDPTGSGDAYRAGLIKGLVSGKQLGEAARMGSTAASFVVEVYGTQEHSFSPGEFQERYEATYG